MKSLSVTRGSLILAVGSKQKHDFTSVSVDSMVFFFDFLKLDLCLVDNIGSQEKIIIRFLFANVELHRTTSGEISRFSPGF